MERFSIRGECLAWASVASASHRRQCETDPSDTDTALNAHTFDGPTLSHYNPIERETVMAKTQPLCLHVYRTGGIWGDDKIIRAEDRKTPRYFSKGVRFSATWQFELLVGGPNGAPICSVKSPYLGPPIAMTDPGPIRITFRSERGRAVKVHLGRAQNGYSFQGLDDRVYRWKPRSRLWGNKMEDEVMATYRIAGFAISKDGELRVHQPGRCMIDLIVATCLAMRTPDH